jgi:hypothetical protein
MNLEDTGSFRSHIQASRLEMLWMGSTALDIFEMLLFITGILVLFGRLQNRKGVEFTGGNWYDNVFIFK